MKIRTLKKTDIKKASRIIGQNYSKLYEKKSLLELEAMFKNHAVIPNYLVVEEKEEIVGLAGYVQSWMDYNIYEIFWVNVLPQYQRMGIGTMLVKKILNIIKKSNSEATILLTTDKPMFYSKKFNFKILSTFEKAKEYLMVLK
ncbi:MAG: GNAT family N-acetyltransferase [Patescibacteria group bacterium]